MALYPMAIVKFQNGLAKLERIFGLSDLILAFFSHARKITFKRLGKRCKFFNEFLIAKLNKFWCEILTPLSHLVKCIKLAVRLVQNSLQNWKELTAV